MNAPVTVTATVAAWISNISGDPARLVESIENGRTVDAIEQMAFYGTPDRVKFGDWLRVGEADVVVRLLPRDEQVSIAVSALKQQLDDARAEWLTTQQKILDRINRLRAITYEAPEELKT